MKITLKTIALLVLLALASAACGTGGGPDAARNRLGGGPGPAGTQSPGARTFAEPSPEARPAETVAEDSSSDSERQAGAPAASAAPSTAKRTEAAAAPGPARPQGEAAPTTTRAPSPPPSSPAPDGGPPTDRAENSTGVTGSGPPAAGERTGVTDAEVLFGMHLPLSGVAGAAAGRVAAHGADAYLRSVNDGGGVFGRGIRLVLADDGYSAQKAAGAIRELVDVKKVFTAAGFGGADQVAVGAEYANKKGVPYLHSGMREQFVADKPWAFPVTTSYAYAGARLVDYLFRQRGYTPARKLGALYLNSTNLDEMVERTESQLRRYGSKLAEKHPAEKDQADFSAAITKMKNAGVDTIWFAVAPELIAKFTAQAKLLQFNPQYVFTASMGSDVFAAAAAGNLDGAFGLATFADPQWSGAAEFRRVFRTYYPDEEPNEGSVLTYVIAQVFVEGLRRAGPDLGRDAFARAMTSIDHFDTGTSSPISSTKRGRVAAANSSMAVWQITGTRTDQITGFEF